jgi:hypothetical protein
MSSDLREQIREVVVLIEDSQAPILGAEVRAGTVDLTSTSTEASPPLRRVVVVASAFAAVLILVGGFAWLSRTTVGTSADEPIPPATIAQVTTTTGAAITTDTVAAPTTTVVAVPILPPGEGPKFSFVQAVLPTEGEPIGGGEWFDGSLFVPWITDAYSLLRSTDGLTWASVPGFTGSGSWGDNMLQADEDRLVNVAVPAEDGSIRIDVSSNGDDWFSSTIDVPILAASNSAGEFHFADVSNGRHSVLAVGPQGIVVAASITLVVDGERFANTLVDAGEGIHVEIIDLDLDRSVMVVAYLDEENDMEQIGDLREIDLNRTSFGRDFTQILEAMAADPDWEPSIDSIVATFTGAASSGYATAVVHYAWFSSDGASWQRIPTPEPRNGGQFASVLATPTGFVATARSGVVLESANGTAWTEAESRGNWHGSTESNLVEWQGEVVEHTTTADEAVWTLTDPPDRVFSDIPTSGMRLGIGDLGLIGTPWHNYTKGPGVTEEVELLLSVDGTSWNRWQPTEFGKNPGWANVSIIGMGDDFVVIQMYTWDASTENGCCENRSHSLWVGTIP